MRNSPVDDIKGGAFAREWSDEQAGGSKDLQKLKEQAFASDMHKADTAWNRMPGVNAKNRRK